MAHIVEFYPAKPKPRTQAQPEIVEACPAKDVLEQVLESADTLKQVAILCMDDNGTIGLISNLEGPAANLFFLKLCEAEIMDASRKPPAPERPRRA